MTIILALLIIVACLLMLMASSKPHMISPNHPEIRRPKR